MKRLLSLVLTLALLGALALPAAAEEDSDARLAAVTLRVKETLGIDTQVYDQFYGDLTENELAPAWYLSWSGEAGSLEVTATEDGKILRYDRYDEDVSNRRDTLSLPEGDPVQAQAAAQAFLDRVLGEEESAELEPFDSGGWLGRTQYGYHGTVRLNGLPSPLSFSLSVRCSDNTVTWFYRDSLEGAYLGGIPAARFRTRRPPRPCCGTPSRCGWSMCAPRTGLPRCCAICPTPPTNTMWMTSPGNWWT